MEKQSSLVDTSVPTAQNMELCSYLPLPTQGFTLAGNALGKSSYDDVTGKSSRRKLNFHTLFTPGRNGIDVVVLVESIRTISERFANTAYGFFLGNQVAYLCSMDGLDAMLKNGPWFIRNNLLILRKCHSDENLVKQDVSTILVWVKLHGIPVTAFSEDSSYARAMIELRAEVELKDNIMAPMPKITGEGYYTCNIRVEYEWKPPRCACCEVFGHVLEECPKNIGASATKNLKKTSQALKGIPIGPKMGYKPKHVFQPFSKKSTANSGGKKKNNSESTKVVSKSNPFEVLTSVDNDVDLGTNRGISYSADMGNSKLMFLDDDENPIIPTDTVDSDSEVEVKDSYSDNDDYDPYDDDMYESHDMSEHVQSICDDLDITEKKVADNIVEEVIVGDTIVGDNFAISNENVVSKNVVVPKANVNVEIIILDDDDIEVVEDTMDTVMAQTDDDIDSCSLEVTMENQLLKATPNGNVKACGNVGIQQVSLEGNMENQLPNVKQSGNVGSQQFIPTRKSQRIQN
ncbi:retrotransposon protein, putative, ty1-copia subclass [Tanacetum coccineum]|uniref:Retrotransposon protein, putative, ty1-copia subclass n=1 Tax=Tanacetum coccineum TaxID=301880 RepID=A0ABQ5FD78_9ASTR